MLKKTHLTYVFLYCGRHLQNFCFTGLFKAIIELARPVIIQMFDANRPQSKNFVIMHCTSGYPTPSQQINLRVIGDLRARYPHIHFGYSGHELGYAPTLGAVALGARVVERHITLDKRSRHIRNYFVFFLSFFQAMVQLPYVLNSKAQGASEPAER